MAPRWRVTASALIALATTVSSQQILPSAASSSFPTCGLSCAVLITAQSTCAASFPAGTAQLTYENCFCTQGSVQPLYASPDGLCTAECTASSDRALLQTWFTSFCKAVGQGIDPQTTTLAAATTAATAASSTTIVTITSTSSYSTASATSSGDSLSNTLTNTKGYEGPWINSHWRWVMMLGILVVGLGLLTWLAIWLKHRHRRKMEAQRIAMSGFPSPTEKRERPPSTAGDLWGPHQYMHASDGWQYEAEAGAARTAPDGRPASAGQQEKRRSKRDSGRSSKRDSGLSSKRDSGRSSKRNSGRISQRPSLEAEALHSESSRIPPMGKKREPGAFLDLSQSSRYGQGEGRGLAR